MKKFVIFRAINPVLDNGKISSADSYVYVDNYEAEAIEDTANYRSHLEAEPICKHFENIGLYDSDCSKVVDGLLVEDVDKTTIKLGGSRTEKLEELRISREPKLIECDIMCNELVCGNRADTADIKTYRDTLLNVTEAYKTDGVANSSCDALVVADFGWPVKP